MTLRLVWVQLLDLVCCLAAKTKLGCAATEWIGVCDRCAS